MNWRSYAECTLSEFFKLAYGYHRRNNKQWEHTRMIIYFIAAANRDPKKSFPSITKFMPLPTDEDNEVKENANEYDDLKGLFDRMKADGRLKPIIKNG